MKMGRTRVTAFLEILKDLAGGVAGGADWDSGLTDDTWDTFLKQAKDVLLADDSSAQLPDMRKALWKDWAL